MIGQFIGVLIMFVLSAALVGLMLLLTSLLGARKGVRRPSAKDIPYECGKDPFNLPRDRRIPVHFYVIGMIFVVFDVEISFLFPWAVISRKLGWLGFVEVLIFLLFILLAYLYARKHRALEAE